MAQATRSVRRAPARAPAFTRAFTRAFTLVEILIVVVILGILATIVIPQFSNASHEARENTLKDALRYLRTQVQVYKAQHLDTAPGYPAGNNSAAPTDADFVDQMSKYTSATSSTSTIYSSSFKYGPYLLRMPENPLNGYTAIVVIPNDTPMRAPASDAYGWIYKPQTQEIIANLIGSDNSGVPYAKY